MKDPLIKCARCGWDKDSSQIHLHHLLPRYLGGVDRDGRRYLCKPCHDKLHIYVVASTLEWMNELKTDFEPKHTLSFDELKRLPLIQVSKSQNYPSPEKGEGR